MLRVNIKKKIGSFQLHVCFETDNTRLALLGSSGCGKSVTLKCIAGVMKPDEGYIELNGNTLFDSKKHINLPPQKRHIGYLFQEYALFPNMTVEQNIRTAVLKKPRQEQNDIIASLIDRYQLNGLEKRKPSQLSGGQKQRVALARIIASEPQVLLLDEPFSAIDSYLKFQLEVDLLDTLSRYDGDVLFVSHSRNEVSTICEDVCVLNKGFSEPKIKVSDLMDHPTTVSAALLSQCANFTGVKVVDSHTVYCPEWDLTLSSTDETASDITTIGIRAEYLQYVPSDYDACSNTNVINCRIGNIVVDSRGDIVLLYPIHSGSDTHYLRMNRTDHRISEELQIGDEIQVHLDPKHVMLLRDSVPVE